MILVIVALSFEHPPGVKIFPAFIMLYFTPIVFMIGMMMAFYGVNKLFAQISSFYAQTQKCAVHRGTIGKGNNIYYCPSCGIVYCEMCFNQVIKIDGCWNYREGAEPESEENWIVDQVLEVKETNRPKPKNRK